MSILCKAYCIFSCHRYGVNKANSMKNKTIKSVKYHPKQDLRDPKWLFVKLQVDGGDTSSVLSDSFDQSLFNANKVIGILHQNKWLHLTGRRLKITVERLDTGTS